MTNHSDIEFNEEELKEILRFEKKIKQIFFKDTKVVICSAEDSILKLAIEINSNFDLPEVISLAKMAFLKKNKQTTVFGLLVLRFQNCIHNLIETIGTPIQIEEVSFYFKNTSLIINSVENCSIAEEMEGILNAILFHFEFYSTLMGSVPNEIHIPVFEGVGTKKLFNLAESAIPPSHTSHYTKYWGLYFDRLKKPLIYNLDRKHIIPGDLDVSLE